MENRKKHKVEEAEQTFENIGCFMPMCEVEHGSMQVNLVYSIMTEEPLELPKYSNVKSEILQYVDAVVSRLFHRAVNMANLIALKNIPKNEIRMAFSHMMFVNIYSAMIQMGAIKMYYYEKELFENPPVVPDTFAPDTDGMLRNWIARIIEENASAYEEGMSKEEVAAELLVFQEDVNEIFCDDISEILYRANHGAEAESLVEMYHLMRCYDVLSAVYDCFCNEDLDDEEIVKAYLDALKTYGKEYDTRVENDEISEVDRLSLDWQVNDLYQKLTKYRAEK